MAMDSTASQWSFQAAYQQMSYYEDTLDDGSTRPQGLDNYAQLRVVTPMAFEKFPLLPRLTFRHCHGRLDQGSNTLF